MDILGKRRLDKYMHKSCLIFILAFITFPLLGQTSGETEDAEQVFAPFVSRLKAKASDSSITLTWRKSDDVQGNNLIYRLNTEITEQNISRAELLARIPSGTESYVDFPPDAGSYYYSVIVESGKGERYGLFIPFRNKTITGAKVKVVASIEQLAAQITDIKTESSNDGIKLIFTNNRPSRDLILYRSEKPIESYRDLLGAVSWLLDRGTGQYQDIPPAGIDYYYTVLDEELVKLGRIALKKGENTTQFPTQMPLHAVKTETSRVQNMRILPLPFLIIRNEIETGNNLDATITLPRKQELGPATMNAVAFLLNRIDIQEKPERQVVILVEDTIDSTDGQVYILKSIISDQLVPGRYKDAGKGLNDFLSIRRTENLTARAHFYLAQTYYFQKLYQKALIEFLMAQDRYYSEVNPWLDACFEKLVSTNQPKTNNVTNRW